MAYTRRVGQSGISDTLTTRKAGWALNWLYRDHPDSWWRPASMWLRTLAECPEICILDTLPDAWPNSPEVNAAETEYILAAREEWPGRILNILPYPPEGSPEWDVWDEMARADDPNFVRSEEFPSISERTRILWTDPEFRAKHRAAMDDMWADPEYRATQSTRAKALNADPEFRAKQKAAVSALWDDPEFREMASMKAKARWADPEYRARLSARHQGSMG